MPIYLQFCGCPDVARHDEEARTKNSMENLKMKYNQSIQKYGQIL
jgi:hypothetical protein